MTEAARQVLEDCRGALVDFKDGLQGGSWRRHYILCITLLRIVGHVLDNVDKLKDPVLKIIIDDEYRKLKNSKKRHQIYWEFIDEERNDLLKEYKTSAGQGVTIKIGQKPAVEYHYVFNDGPFKERDQREVIQEAIVWWKSYLDNIDKRYERGKSIKR